MLTFLYIFYSFNLVVLQIFLRKVGKGGQEIEDISPDLKKELNIGRSDPAVGCMHASVDPVYPGYKKNKPVQMSTHTINKHNNTFTFMLSISKSDTAIQHTAHKHNQNTYKSDTHINEITQDVNFIKNQKHIPTEDKDITADNKIEPETKELIEGTESLDEIAAKYEQAVDLGGLVEINERFAEGPSIDELVEYNSLDNINGRSETVSSESFDQLAAKYEEEEVNLDELVEINLPYCDNADLDKLVQNNLNYS